MRKSVGKQKLGKGFYMALILSVVAVSTTAYFTLSGINGDVKENEYNSEIQNITDWSVPEISDVNKVESGVPLEEASEEAEETNEQVKTPNTNGAYIMPLTGEIINPFSNGELVKSKTLGEWRTHDGIDIKASEGTPVKSCFDGTVKEITNDPKWGVMVEVEYPVCTVYYCGMADTLKVKKGQEIKLGDVIGEVGNTTLVESGEESHLHLAMKKDGEWIDPMKVITKN